MKGPSLDSIVFMSELSKESGRQTYPVSSMGKVSPIFFSNLLFLIRYSHSFTFTLQPVLLWPPKVICTKLFNSFLLWPNHPKERMVPLPYKWCIFFSNQQPHYNNTSQLIKQGNHKFSSSLYFPSNGWSPCICSLSFSSSSFHCTPQHSRPFLSLISLELHTWRKFKLNFWFWLEFPSSFSLFFLHM